MTLETLSRYLLRNRKAEDVRAAELCRREMALAELQHLIFVNATRAYLENSIRSRLRRTLPYVRAWEAKYREHGLVVIGMQTPEFAFEKERVCRSLNWRKRTWQPYSTMMR